MWLHLIRFSDVKLRVKMLGRFFKDKNPWLVFYFADLEEVNVLRVQNMVR